MVEVEEVVEVAAVSTTLTLDQNAEEVDFDELRQRLATLYNVPASTIRLGLSGGSVVIVLEIIATNASESSAIASAVAATTSDSLTSVLGSVAVISSVQQVVRNETIRRNQTVELQLDCPVGHWCTAGLVVECEFGFYNPTRNANNQTACLPCPEQSTTLTAAASSADQCICVVGYYDAQLPSANESSGVTCSPCKNAIPNLVFASWQAFAVFASSQLHLNSLPNPSAILCGRPYRDRVCESRRHAGDPPRQTRLLPGVKPLHERRALQRQRGGLRRDQRVRQ